MSSSISSNRFFSILDGARATDVRVDVDGQDRVHGLSVGPTVYELRKPAVPRCVESGSGFEFSLPSLSRLVGRGASRAAAEAQWGLLVHVTLQRLLRRRGEALPKQDERLWTEIEACVDLEQLERGRTFTLRQLGEVREVHDDGLSVTWIGYDDRPEFVPFGSLPREAAAFDPGERFDAIVLRRRGDLRLVEVLSGSVLPTPTRGSEREMLDAVARARRTTDVCDATD